MISSKRLAQMARKWLRAATAGRRRIAFRRRAAATAPDSDAGASAAPARKGCFVVYSSDGQRLEVPLPYLNSHVFGELLKMAEDAFGLPGDGPITLPCDAAFMGSVISCLHGRRSSREAEGALLSSIASRPCSALLAPCPSLIEMNQQLVVCGC